MSMPAGGWQSDSGLLDVYDIAETAEHSILIDYAVFFGVIAIFVLIFHVSTKDK